MYWQAKQARADVFALAVAPACADSEAIHDRPRELGGRGRRSKLQVPGSGIQSRIYIVDGTANGFRSRVEVEKPPASDGSASEMWVCIATFRP